MRSTSGRVGLALVLLAVGMATLGPLAAPYDPFAISGGSLVPPSPAHWMGTDALGRDVFSAVLYGARTSLVVACMVTLVALICGGVVGLMRATEFFQVVPRFFFAVIAIALLGPGLDRTILTIGLTSWPVLARVVRSEVIATRHLDFVRASEALGASGSHVVLRQILPGLFPIIVVTLGLLFGQVLLLEATLAFLGLGDPAVVSWGMMAAQAQGFLRVAWWLALFPGLAICLTVLGVNLVADTVSARSSVG